MECKGQWILNAQQLSPVLIETLWNVKLDRLDAIDEYVEGINRNIMECKVNCSYTSENVNFVLIETLWNVKFDNRYFSITKKEY